MSFNLNCFPNLNLGALCSCKPKTKSPSPSPSPEPIDESEEESVILIEYERIHFEELIPSHKEYMYLKILKTKSILCASGGLIEVFKMKKEDLVEITLFSVTKNKDLFRDYIYSLVTRTFENGTAYQFCFRIERHERIFCCTIYPCSILGHISSVDCIIRPVIEGFRPSSIDKYIIPIKVENRNITFV